MLPENFNLEPDETVLLEIEHEGIEGGACLVMLLGIFLFLIPTLLAFIYLMTQRRKWTDSKLVVTNRRIIVQNWGVRDRFLDLGYDRITGIVPSFSSGLGSSSKGTAVINLANGTRLELSGVEGVAHFADVAQRAMEAYKSR